MKPTFENIVKDYINLVYFFAKRWVKEQEKLDDIVQSTFLKALKKYDGFTFKSDGELKSWLLTICRNTIMDEFRITTKQKSVSIETNNIEILDDSNIDEWLEEQMLSQDMEAIQRELQNMKPDDQEVIKLRIFDELEFKQIGSILELSEARVKMRYYRAIEKLKEAVVCNTKTV